MNGSNNSSNKGWLWFLVALGIELALLYWLATSWTLPAAPAMPFEAQPVVTKSDPANDYIFTVQPGWCLVIITNEQPEPCEP